MLTIKFIFYSLVFLTNQNYTLIGYQEVKP